MYCLQIKYRLTLNVHSNEAKLNFKNINYKIFKRA